MDIELLKKNLTMGKRLDGLARITGIGALFCLPRAADDDNMSDVTAGTSGKPWLTSLTGWINLGNWFQHLRHGFSKKVWVRGAERIMRMPSETVFEASYASRWDRSLLHVCKAFPPTGDYNISGHCSI
jgi:hypothetical protein